MKKTIYNLKNMKNKKKLWYCEVFEKVSNKNSNSSYL